MLGRWSLSWLSRKGRAGKRSQRSVVRRPTFHPSFEVLEGRELLTFTALPNFGVATGPVAIGVGDFNGDGATDIATAGGGFVSVLLGNGGLPNPPGVVTFNGPTNFPGSANQFPGWMVVADLDKNGKSDVALANSSMQSGMTIVPGTTVTVLLAAPTGVLQPPTSYPTGGSGPLVVLAADFNNDGFDDLITANAVSNNASVLLNDGKGKFGGTPIILPFGTTPAGLAVGRVNPDSFLDVAVSNFSNNSVSVAQGTGSIINFPFTFPVGSGPRGLQLVDVNQDGLLDIIVANSGSNNIGVLLGKATTNINATSFGPMTTYTTNGMFTGSMITPVLVRLADFNGDGFLDIMSLNTGSNNLTILNGKGDGTFVPNPDGPIALPGGSGATQFAIGDFNNDCAPDVAVANTNLNNVTVFINNDQPAAASLQLTAPVTVTAGQTFQITVTARTPCGGIATNYTGTVHFDSSDVFAGLPPDYTFVPADMGVRTFNIRVNTPGSQFVRVTDTLRPSLTATQNFTVVPRSQGPIGRPYAVGADAGAPPWVRVFSPNVPGQLMYEFFAYDANFRGGVRVAGGDVDGDGTQDIICVPGPGGGPHVIVYSGADLSILRSFFAYAPNFTGGLFVASGDVNDDGFDDIITGADAGGGPHVMVRSGKDNSILASFFAFDPAFRGGVRVAAGDINGDGFFDVVAGAGPGAGPHVRVFNLAGGPPTQMPGAIGSFFAYDPRFTGGVFVASGDFNGDGFFDVVTGPGQGGGPHIQTFNGRTSVVPPASSIVFLIGSFMAYPPNGTSGNSLYFSPGGAPFTSGVRVGAADTDGQGNWVLVTVPGRGQPPLVRTFNPLTYALLDEMFAFDPSWLFGAFVAGRR
ncbi:MAG: VCBS repeat-containing protein [Gemmataceae bacterium]|nr:VCBS repeat-containing protein [Gemmataceae bacterium]MDW8263810.1 VCBS repeat-containing protein [Gemmataceae bacterium]